MTQEEKSRFPATFLAGLAAVVLALAATLLLTRNPKTAGTTADRLPMGSAEQAYARNVRFVDLRMSRAANFLNQQVTFLFGSLSNEGTRSIRDIEVTVEFLDSFNRVVLRERQRLWSSRAGPLRPGDVRQFQLGFEHIPADWNHQYPSIRVTGLLLE